RAVHAGAAGPKRLRARVRQADVGGAAARAVLVVAGVAAPAVGAGVPELALADDLGVPLLTEPVTAAGALGAPRIGHAGAALPVVALGALAHRLARDHGAPRLVLAVARIGQAGVGGARALAVVVIAL